MAAGLGFKTFTTGEVLTAADTNGYLMQGVLVFANAAARTAAITSPQEGQMSYLKDTNSVESYSGTAWVAVGGASGGETLLSTTTLSGSSTTISSIPTTYQHLRAIIVGVYASGQDEMTIRFNGDTGSNYNSGFSYGSSSSGVSRAATSGVISYSYNTSSISFQTALDLNIPRYSITSGIQMFGFNGWMGQTRDGIAGGGTYTNKSAAITSITFLSGTSTFTAGTVFLYGVN